MPLIDHLGITVDDLERGVARFDPVLQALGCEREDADGSVAWSRADDSELILFPAREPGTGPHTHGRVGWQHLAFAVDSRSEVDRLHAIALDAGWSACASRRSTRATPTATTRHSSRTRTESASSSCTTRRRGQARADRSATDR